MRKMLNTLIASTVLVGCISGCGQVEQTVIESSTTAQQMAGTEQNETQHSEVTDYDQFIEELPSEDYYAEIELGLTYPLLLVTDGVYDNLDGNTAVTIEADAYYIVDGEVKNVGKVSSSGTAYPLAVDQDGIYEAGNHWGAKLIYNESTNTLEVSERVLVQYEAETGNATYTIAHDGEESLSTEEEFTAFFEAMGKAKVINFNAAN